MQQEKVVEHLLNVPVCVEMLSVDTGLETVDAAFSSKRVWL